MGWHLHYLRYLFRLDDLVIPLDGRLLERSRSIAFTPRSGRLYHRLQRFGTLSSSCWPSLDARHVVTIC